MNTSSGQGDYSSSHDESFDEDDDHEDTRGSLFMDDSDYTHMKNNPLAELLKGTGSGSIPSVAPRPAGAAGSSSSGSGTTKN